MRNLAVIVIVVLALLVSVALVVGILACGVCRRGQPAGQPTVRLLSPPEGTQIAVNRQIYIQARAFARGGVVRIDFAVNGNSIGSQSPSGSQLIFAAAQPWTASAAGTYTLSATAYDATGQASDADQVTIAVLEPGSFAPPSGAPPTGVTPVPGTTPSTGGWPEPVVDFRADRTSIQAGECTTLRWDVEYVQEVYLDGGGVSGHGTRDVCPSQTQTYVLHVILPSGESRDYTVTIEVTGQTEITTGPDLAMLAVDCPGGQSDEPIPFQAQVQNQGDQAAQSAQWRWSVNNAGAGPGQWNQGGTFTLDPGATTLLQGSIPAGAAGNWTVYVEVRVDGETVTGNNQGSANFAVTAPEAGTPDLAVLAVDCPGGRSDESIPFQAQVRNVGDAVAQGAQWRWHVNTANGDIGGPSAAGEVFTLDPGATTLLQGSIPPLTAGNWTLYLDVRVGGETNPANNQGTVNFTVTGPQAGGGADLEIAGIARQPAQPAANQQISFEVRVRNTGSTDANGATLSWILGRTGQDPGGNWHVEAPFNVPAGQTVPVAFTISGRPSGNWTLNVEVHLDGEGNTGNNQRAHDFTIQ